jgi:hypothetical protein
MRGAPLCLLLLACAYTRPTCGSPAPALLRAERARQSALSAALDGAPAGLTRRAPALHDAAAAGAVAARLEASERLSGTTRVGAGGRIQGRGAASAASAALSSAAAQGMADEILRNTVIVIAAVLVGLLVGVGVIMYFVWKSGLLGALSKVRVRLRDALAEQRVWPARAGHADYDS